MIERAVWNATTKEQFYNDYHYYVGYNILMYGENAWMVPYGRFVKEYPRWCPVWKLDLTRNFLPIDGVGALPKNLPLSTQGGYPGVPILAGLDGGVLAGPPI